MQLFALDQDNHPVAARHASKKRDYICLECQAAVRCRSGPHRQAHFFHLKPSATCKLSGKGIEHLQVQCRLRQLLPEGECFLEHRFPELGRIADVAWLPRRLIFEIQCSPISSEEIAARNRDYASLGFQVIWILHDKRYNQRRVSEAEQGLKDQMHYYTNIDAEDKGQIYDQYETCTGSFRLKRSLPVAVDLSQPKENRERLFRPNWPLHFAGDLVDRQFRPSLQKETLSLAGSLFKWLLGWYDQFLQTLLERSCK
ncbi:MAG: hypothetical protein LLG04_03200 [Parachlamydia sp.]|nr:hypothetical protein [Parachlamydia sp.]